jgi:hypothetical protein
VSATTRPTITKPTARIHSIAHLPWLRFRGGDPILLNREIEVPRVTFRLGSTARTRSPVAGCRVRPAAWPRTAERHASLPYPPQRTF